MTCAWEDWFDIDITADVDWTSDNRGMVVVAVILVVSSAVTSFVVVGFLVLASEVVTITHTESETLVNVYDKQTVHAVI